MTNWIKRLTKSKNETFSIFVTIGMGVLSIPLFVLFGTENIVLEFTYSLATIFAFVSASSYLGKSLGKIVQFFKGDEINFVEWLLKDKQKLNTKPKRNIEGFATALAFIAGAVLATAILIVAPSTINFGNLELLHSILIRPFYVLFNAGLAASLSSRVFRLFDHDAEERKQTYYYTRFVIAALVLSAAMLAYIGADLFTAGLLTGTLRILTVVSTSVSLLNYLGKIADQFANNNINNETLGLIAGVGLGIVFGALIITSALATGGLSFGLAGIVAASFGPVLGKAAFVFFFTSITTGFCRRVGTLFDEIFTPNKTILNIFDNLFVTRIKVEHKLPLILTVEDHACLQRGLRIERASDYGSAPKITKALNGQYKPVPTSVINSEIETSDVTATASSRPWMLSPKPATKPSPPPTEHSSMPQLFPAAS